MNAPLVSVPTAPKTVSPWDEYRRWYVEYHWCDRYCRVRSCSEPLRHDDFAVCRKCAAEQPRAVEFYDELMAKKAREAIRVHAAKALEQLPAWHRGKTLTELYACIAAPLRPFAERFVLGARSAEVSGKSGDGKTAAAAMVVKRVAEISTAEDFDVRVPAVWALRGFLWMTAHALVKARKEHSLGEGEAPLIERAKAAHVLVLDELGFEPRSEVPFEIVDERYAAGKTTVVTTGLRPPEFQTRYGQALHRRLTEKGVGTLVSSFPREKN